MAIRNIINKDVVSISNCESEPIHIPGSIQPHGFLLGINESDYSINPDYAIGHQTFHN
jgi:two-component system, chemotaxis family, sensor kinase Cph1